MILYTLLAITLVSKIYGALNGPPNELLTGPPNGLPGGLSYSEDLNFDDPWLLKKGHEKLFDEYTVHGKPFTEKNCSFPWIDKYSSLNYDDSFSCPKINQPSFHNTWLNTLGNFERKLSPNMTYYLNKFYNRVRNNPEIFNDGVRTSSYRRLLKTFFPEKLLPADCSNFNSASLAQLTDILEFWHFVDKGAFTACKNFAEKSCGSGLNFCDKPKMIDSLDKSYTDVCAEYKVDLPWITVQRHQFAPPTDCWVVPGQKLYYVKCHTPGKKFGRKCKFDYHAPDSYVCVPSANVKRKVWAFCPIPEKDIIRDRSLIDYPPFHPYLFEVITPTACSCKKCHCCQYT